MKETKKEKLFRLLEGIGFKLHDHGHGHYFIYDSNNNCTDYMVYGDFDTRIQHELGDYKGGMNFYLKDCTISMLKDSKTTVCVQAKGTKSVFINFHNFSLK